MSAPDLPMLIALVALQFFLHAVGWAMAARLFGGWRAPEAQFAGFWLALALGLSLYVPPWPSGHAMRNLGNLLIVGAAALQHRGLAMYWARPLHDRCYGLLLALAALVVGASLRLEHGHGLRVAAVCVGVGVLLLGSCVLLWRHGRRSAPVFAPVVAAAHALLAAALLARAVEALASDGPAKVSIDAPSPPNVALVMMVMFVGGCMNLAQIRLVLGRVLQRLTTQARTDALTGAVNRRGLQERLERVHARVQGGASGIYAVLMVDIDHFKAVNDRHGHAVGDDVLRRVASGLRDRLRAGDVVARWGGEEFCVLLPRIGAGDAQALAQRVVEGIASQGEPRVTVSMGVAQVHPGDDGAAQVIRRADEALYRAKRAGRNRVVLAEVAPAPEPASSASISLHAAS